jgi:hypothetical protein
VASICFCSSNLSDDTKIEELKVKIAEITQVEPPIQIRSGFPPKVLEAADEITLKSSGISSGGKKHNNHDNSDD